MSREIISSDNTFIAHEDRVKMMVAAAIHRAVRSTNYAYLCIPTAAATQRASEGMTTVNAIAALDLCSPLVWC